MYMEKCLIVHVVVINNKKILILKRVKKTYLGGLWDIPGGTLEDGETPKKGAMREVFEETSLKLAEAALFYCYSNMDQKKNKQFITLIFIAKSDRKNIKTNPKEHSEYFWIKPDEIKSYKTVNYLPACVKYLKRKRPFNLIS